MNLAKGGLSSQLSPLTNFLHTVPALAAFLASLVLFLVLAKSERLGGLQFRHVILALVYGLVGGVLFSPPTLDKELGVLTKSNSHMTAFLVFFGIVVVEVIMIIRDRRKAGGGE